MKRIYKITAVILVLAVFAVLACACENVEVHKANTASESEEKVVDTAEFDWDIDGDGNTEKATVRWIDNGDEPAQILVEVEGNGINAVLYLDNAYLPVAAGVMTDGMNDFLRMVYCTGDNDSHDTEAVANIYYSNGSLVLVDDPEYEE